MTSWIVFRLLKFLGLALLSLGVLGPVFTAEREQRSRLYSVAAVGWLLVWLSGYGLLKAKGLQLSEDWATAGLVWSAVAVSCALAAVERPAVAGLGAYALVAGLVPMVQRQVDPLWMLSIGLVPGAVFGVLGQRQATTGAAPSTWGWFRAVAWAEGLSLLALFGVYMPAKYVWHVELDGGQGWFGWVHGMLFVLYLVALGRWVLEGHAGTGARIRSLVLGFVAAMLPFGTFVYERLEAPAGDGAGTAAR